MIIKLYYKAILYSLYKAISLYQIFDFWARRHILSMRGMMMPYSATVIELPFHSVLTSSMSIGEGWLHVKIGKFWRMVSILMVIPYNLYGMYNGIRQNTFEGGDFSQTASDRASNTTFNKHQRTIAPVILPRGRN